MQNQLKYPEPVEVSRTSWSIEEDDFDTIPDWEALGSNDSK